MITKENLGVCFWFLSIIVRNEIAFLYHKSMQILPPIDLKCNVNNSSPFKPCQLGYYLLLYILNSKKHFHAKFDNLLQVSNIYQRYLLCDVFTIRSYFAFYYLKKIHA